MFSLDSSGPPRYVHQNDSQVPSSPTISGSVMYPHVLSESESSKSKGGTGDAMGDNCPGGVTGRGGYTGDVL